MEIEVRAVTPPEMVTRDKVVMALLATGQIDHLTVAWEGEQPTLERQEPPVLPGEAVSEVILAQRAGVGL